MDMHTCIDEHGRNESTRRIIPHKYTPEVPTCCRQPGHSRRIKNCLYKVEFKCCFHQLYIWEGTLQHTRFFVVYLSMIHCAWHIVHDTLCMAYIETYALPGIRQACLAWCMSRKAALCLTVLLLLDPALMSGLACTPCIKPIASATRADSTTTAC